MGIRKITNINKSDFFSNVIVGEVFNYSQIFSPQELIKLAHETGVDIEYCPPKTKEYKKHGCYTMIVVGNDHSRIAKLKVWIYVWKACRNHNEERPSNSDYKLIDIENYFGIEAYEKMNDEERWHDFAEDWAIYVDSDGSNYGYQYGWKVKEPSQEWLLKKIERENKSIEHIKSHIGSLEKYLK